MPSRRYVRGWGALSVAIGAVLVTTAAQPPAASERGSVRSSAAVVEVDGCPDGGGLCAVPRHSVAMSGAHTLAGRPVMLDARVTGPVRLVLRTPGRLADVTVTDARGRRVAGTPAPDGTHWTSAAALPAGGRYTARLVVEGTGEGPEPYGSGGGREPHRRFARLEFRTPAAPAGERLTVAFGPENGRTYGVGQPITAELSHPVPESDPAARRVVESALRVRSSPRVEGSWHWVDSVTLHYRPRTYWPARATVHVRSGLDGIRVGPGLQGGPSRPLTFTTGDRVEAVTDVAALHMTVYRDGRAIRTIPVTTGKPGFRTRGGIKVVLGKEPLVRMRGDSIGIPKGSRDFYDLKVRWATRVTWSGEYLHAAPWSVDAQGSENVSHGCTGMSTEDAAWLFRTVREGDVVRVVNGYGKPMAPFGNGFGDWNLSWTAWRSGSALTDHPGTEPAEQAGGGLRPAL
ncbi:Ig-like domain-containing protein [Streptomyces sp. NPDC056144]|uniref:L,D-transpeptidase n=1 Tax=unclassified Streptomyces TaxID=2593676 RepID=UPI0035E35D10